MTLVVRNASVEEFAVAVGWAREEGWNPGLDDLPAFFAADPKGFFMGFLDGVPVSSISVVRYGSDYGFLGFYIVAPDHRGSGIGFRTWNAGMSYLEGRTVGLDGVVDQQDNYRKSDFTYAGRNIRFSGTPRQAAKFQNAWDERALVELSQNLVPEVANYDRPFFPADRSTFLRDWTSPASGTRRKTWAYSIDGRISGYVTVRQCGVGYKVGPLFADSQPIAAALLARVVATIDVGGELTIDVPEANPVAVALAESFGLLPVFETARMYRIIGEAGIPKLETERTYGVTSFELG